MKVNTLDTIGIIFVIFEIVMGVVIQQLENAPVWMHYVIFICIVGHFVLRHKEKKQNQ